VRAAQFGIRMGSDKESKSAAAGRQSDASGFVPRPIAN
jgi:hypothetical protein